MKKYIELTAQHLATESQIKTARRRATICCSEYNSNNLGWMQVDRLSTEQIKVVQIMSNLTTKMIIKSNRNDKVQSVFGDFTDNIEVTTLKKKATN